MANAGRRVKASRFRSAGFANRPTPEGLSAYRRNSTESRGQARLPRMECANGVVARFHRDRARNGIGVADIGARNCPMATPDFDGRAAVDDVGGRDLEDSRHQNVPGLTAFIVGVAPAPAFVKPIHSRAIVGSRRTRGRCTRPPRLHGGYAASGRLGGGNIQLFYKPCQ